MGRDVAGLRIDNKRPTMRSNGVAVDRVHVAPKISVEKPETKEHEVDDQKAKGTNNEESQEKQDVLGVKSTNTEVGLPEGRTKVEALKPSEKKLSTPVKPAPETVPAESLQTNSPMTQTPELSTEKHASDPNSPLMSRKLLDSDDNKKHQYEDDNYSVASSAAISVRSIRKVTVGVAPTFRSAERAARRREFYTKLEEKHKALETEKLEYEARTKEEEAAAIQQLRKTMVYKANPVPSFYREGPPPKVELKKLPLTRPKSPNLTRRKSCSDAVKSSPVENKACARGTRHSIGVCRDGNASPKAPKNKDLSGTHSGNGPSKFKDSNGTCKVKARPKQEKQMPKDSHAESEQMSTDIPVVSETKTSYTAVDHSADPAVEEEPKKASFAMTDQKRAGITVTGDTTKNSMAAEPKTADVVS